MALRGGIDLGGTKIEAIVVDDGSTIIGSARRETPRVGGPRDVVHELAAALVDAAAAAHVEPSQLAGVGVGSPGEVDREAGTVARAGNLPGWKDAFPLAAALSERVGTRVAVGNDVRARCRGGARARRGQDLSVVPRRLVGNGNRRRGRDRREAVARSRLGRRARARRRPARTARRVRAAGAAASRRTRAAGRWSAARGARTRRA